MKKYKLGEKITILYRLKRQRTGRYLNWTIQMYSQPRTVTVIGVRVLWDGEMDLGEDGVYFVGTRAKRALLVAEDLRGCSYVWAD
jgi:hypothetical protein